MELIQTVLHEIHQASSDKGKQWSTEVMWQMACCGPMCSLENVEGYCSELEPVPVFPLSITGDSVQACLDSFTRCSETTEKIINCPKCQDKETVVRRMHLCVLPNVLVIQLK